MDKLFFITRLLTFPGALIRCFFEHLVCKLYQVPVEDNRMMRCDEMAGHIEHELFPKTSGAFAVAFVPAFLNGILSFLLFLLPFANTVLFQFDDIWLTVLGIISIWLAVSLYVNSYPTVEDAINLMEKLYGSKSVAAKIIYSPAFLFLFIGAYAEKYMLTFVLGVGATTAFCVIVSVLA